MMLRALGLGFYPDSQHLTFVNDKAETRRRTGAARCFTSAYPLECVRSSSWKLPEKRTNRSLPKVTARLARAISHWSSPSRDGESRLRLHDFVRTLAFAMLTQPG